MQITNRSAALGADVTDVDVMKLSDNEFDAISAAFADRGVLFFEPQDLDPNQQVEFAKRFGDIDVNRFFASVDGHPDVALVLKEPTDTLNIGGGWHTDHSYDVEPAKASLLHAKDVPDVGGDTMWASMGAAYDALSPGFKQMLSGLRAVHRNEHAFGAAAAHLEQFKGRFINADKAHQVAVHPVVIAHPVTGRPLLYVNPGFTTAIEGWHPKESRALLDYLFSHASQAQFTVRFTWRPGAMAIWDNRSTWHYALNDYEGVRRCLHRVTIAGQELAAAS